MNQRIRKNLFRKLCSKRNCKTEITARVTVENGETVIYKEEAINQLLEKEFTDAINALAEE